MLGSRPVKGKRGCVQKKKFTLPSNTARAAHYTHTAGSKKDISLEKGVIFLPSHILCMKIIRNPDFMNANHALYH
jgi:hypothetical protein